MSRVLPVAAAAALFALAAVLLFSGFERLAFREGHFMAIDYRYRWGEQRLVAAGVDPYKEYARQKAEAIAAHDPPHGRRLTPGWPSAAPSYPPWAFAYGMFLAPPVLNWSAARLWFALLNAAALVFLASWTYRKGRVYGRGVGLLFSATSLSLLPHLYALTQGQYGILICACLAGSLVLAERGRYFEAGLFCGLALLKPNLAAFFPVAFLLASNWRAVAGTMLPVIAGSGVTWALTGATPWAMIASMVTTGLEWAEDSSGLVSVLAALGVAPELAGAALPVIVGGMTLLLLVRARRAPLEIRFAIAACAGLLWTYHKPYDHALLLFPAIALARLVAWRTTWIHVLALALLLLPQIAPLRMRDHLDPRVALLETMGWIAAVAIVYRNRDALEGPRYGDTPRAPRCCAVRSRCSLVRTRSPFREGGRTAGPRPRR